ncbi:hypothetical protein M0811_10631 [Anaeramoeba ignava]|uniref:BTB domain-containing protein n=1 Tax=Anaeramoeba ignava TaxID=1746090 RepID=A0A9Q0LE05_ANAIG|nr:hypothetical protein M0811_10631 [Anaeramoeba ignava]
MKKFNQMIFFGENKYQKLLKNESETIKPIQFKFENEIEKELDFENENQLCQISSGNHSTIFLFENGKAAEYLNQNLKKMENEDIQKVTVGFENEAILTIKEDVLAKGFDIDSNNRNKFINISSLIEDKNDRIIQDFICGARSIYLLTSNQNAYGIGSNEYNQLGFDSKSLYKTEKPILMKEKISQIFSGNSSYHVFLLNSNQELFGCGNNIGAQLGLGNDFMEEKVLLSKIQNIPKGKIIDIKCGNFHSIMLIEFKTKRKLYSCGLCQYTGLGKENEIIGEFTEIDSSSFENDDDDILDFSCGSEHTLILTKKGKLIGFGSNSYGQLGTGDAKDQLIPTQIEIPKLAFDDISNYQISCSKNGSFLSSISTFSSIENDLVTIFQRKEFCDVFFDTKNPNEKIGAHKLILDRRLGSQFDDFKELISRKSIQEANQIFEVVYGRNQIKTKEMYEIVTKFNLFEPIRETMKEIFESKNDSAKNVTIHRNGQSFKFPKILLIARSGLFKKIFLEMEGEELMEFDNYSELSDDAFEIIEYWIYSNQIKEGIEITEDIIDEFKTGTDYFQLNQAHPNLLDLLLFEFENQKQN